MLHKSRNCNLGNFNGIKNFIPISDKLLLHKLLKYNT
jgi:hypothetical protein